MPAAEPQPLSRLIEEQETRTVASRLGSKTIISLNRFIQLIGRLNNSGNWTFEKELETKYKHSFNE